MDCVHMADLNTLQNLQQRFATLQADKHHRSVTQLCHFVACSIGQVKSLYKLFMSQTTHTVAHRMIAAETCCTACSLPFAADSVYCVE